MRLSKKSKILIYILLIAIALYFLFPFIYMLLTVFKTEAEANAYPPRFFPKEWRWGNFAAAWKSQPFGLYFFNSVLITVMTTIGQLIACSLTAYGFARYRFKGKTVLLINTLKPSIVPALFGSANYIFLMLQFLAGVPRDFEEAARIDGAHAFQIYALIFMPILKPQLILVAVLNMLTVWNDYLGPLIFLQSRAKYTLALGLASFKGVHDTQIIPILCITVIMIIPPIVLFMIAQKYIIEGTSGAIK